MLDFIKTKKLIEADDSLEDLEFKKCDSRSDIHQRSLVLPRISSVAEEFNFDSIGRYSKSNHKRNFIYVKSKLKSEERKPEKTPSINAFRNLTLRIKLRNKGHSNTTQSFEDWERYSLSDKNSWDNPYGHVWQNDRAFVRKWIEHHKRDIENSISKMIKLSRYNASHDFITRERIFDEDKVNAHVYSKGMMDKFSKTPLKNMTQKYKSIHIEKLL